MIRLAQAAEERRISRFFAEVLPESRHARRLPRRVRDRKRQRADATEIEVPDLGMAAPAHLVLSSEPDADERL